MQSSDFTLAWEGAPSPGAWSHFEVVRFSGVEEMSSLYRYEITVSVKPPMPEPDPREIVGKRATLRIATTTDPPYRVVHGVIAEAEELGDSHGAMLYRIVLMPPLVRAAHRRRSRIFLDKTLRQILTAVLTGDPRLAPGGEVEPDDGDAVSYTPAAETFCFRVTDTSRLDSPAARAYCVQYAETDLAFVMRLLEDEGWSFHYENGRGASLLVISDRDGGRARLDPFLPLAPNVRGREVNDVKLGARLRPSKVSLGEYNWKKPSLDMSVERGEGADLVDQDYPGGYVETPALGAPLAEARLSRYQAEADYAVAESRCRLLAAGTIFDLSHPKSRYEGEHLVTRIEIRAEQGGVVHISGGHDGRGAAAGAPPYTAKLECARRGRAGAPAESRWAPPQVTPRPRIHGTQTAVVTADPSAPGAEINVGGPPGGDIGCVRLRFRWDRDSARLAKEPSSCWVRVSQVFAGAGQGGIWHPRVGVEVIVDFEDGDPDRPLVTGRVYNGQNLPTAGPPTYSSLKSFSSPGGGGFNEISFEDAAGGEQITVHAARDSVEQVGRDRSANVGRDRSEQVGNNSTSLVGVDRSETTGGSRSTMVNADNTEVVGSNASMQVGANHSVVVGGAQSTVVGGDQSAVVSGSQSASVFGSRQETVDGGHALTVQGEQSVSSGGAQTITTASTQGLSAAGAQSIHSDTSQDMTAPAQTFTATGDQQFGATTHGVTAGTILMRGDAIIMESGGQVIANCYHFVGQGNGGAELISSGKVTIRAPEVVIEGGQISISNGVVSITASAVTVDGGGGVDMTAGVIKLN